MASNTTLSLTISPPTINQTIPSQGTNVSPLAPRALVFSTSPSLPLEPNPYLNSLDNLPPRNSNPPPPSLSQGLSQTLSLPTPMDFKLSFPPIDLSRSRMCAQPKPFLSRDQVMQQLSQYQDFNRHLEAVIQNSQNVQNSLLPLFTTTSPQMPSPINFTTTFTTSIPPFRTSHPPSSTFVPLDQSLWMEGPSFSQLQEYIYLHCQRTKSIVNNLQNEMRSAGSIHFGKPVPFMDGTGWNR
ncbi:hypothetical protein Tco_1539583 [Tanacetum coccineum]